MNIEKRSGLSNYEKEILFSDFVGDFHSYEEGAKDIVGVEYFCENRKIKEKIISREEKEEITRKIFGVKFY